MWTISDTFSLKFKLYYLSEFSLYGVRFKLKKCRMLYFLSKSTSKYFSRKVVTFSTGKLKESEVTLRTHVFLKNDKRNPYQKNADMNCPV